MFNKTTVDTIKKLAEKYEYEAEALLAVVDVESAGVAFWNINGEAKPPIRFEGHYFYGRLNKTQRAQAVKEGLASPTAGAIQNPDSYAGRYELLERAAKIDREAAYESTSWGLGQVMGANWKDLQFASVNELVEFSKSLTGQVELMIRFIETNNLKDEIDEHRWGDFAARYNGPTYKKNAYDTKMAKAYTKYKGSTIVEADEATIIQLQTMLNKITPEYALTLDGKLGPKTKAALKDFQLKNGLKSDGIYGGLTRGKIEMVYLAQSNQTQQNAAIGGMTSIGVGTAITEAAKNIEPFKDASQYIQWIFIGLLVVGVLFTLKTYLWPKKVV